MADIKDRAATFRIVHGDKAPEDYIRALIAEAGKIEEPRPVGAWEWIYSNPGLLESRAKTPDQRLADTRRQFVMDELLKKYPAPSMDRPNSWDGIPGDVQRDMALYAGDASEGMAGDWRDAVFGRRGMRTNITSPYEATGVLGPGSGLSNFMTWAQSAPAAAYAAAGSLANAADYAASNATGGEPIKAGAYPTASQDFGRAVRTFVGPASPYAATSDDQSAWSKKASVRTMAAQSDLERWQDMGAETREFGRAIEAAVGNPKTGEEFLAGAGVSPRVAKWGGAVMDATLDPFTGHIPAIRAARAGKAASAAATVGMDYGVPVGLTGLASLAERPENTDGYIVYDANGNPRKATKEDFLIERLGR